MQEQLKKLEGNTLREAIDSLQKGNTAAFEPIYLGYFGLVHRICMRMLGDPTEAEDVAHDTFIHLFRKIHTFRGESAFSSWLYRLTTNLVLMRFRKRHHKVSSLDEILDTEDQRSIFREIGGPDLHLAGLFDRINLQATIDLLPKGYKTAFILHDIYGYCHKEIAEICGCSSGNSKSQVHKARQRLRTLLRASDHCSIRRNPRITNRRATETRRI